MRCSKGSPVRRWEEVGEEDEQQQQQGRGVARDHMWARGERRRRRRRRRRGRGYFVSFFNCRHAFPNRFNNAASLVPEDGREEAFWIGAFQSVYIRVAKGIGMHLQPDLACFGGSCIESGGTERMIGR